MNRPRPAELAALCAVAVAVAWNLFWLRAETLPVAYLNDSSVHEQMVRFATAQLRDGRLPLTSWFPYLGLGSPHFLHYQSLPAMLTGAVGILTGPDRAFRWSLYLLLCSWPVSIYAAARIFGLGRAAAAAAALLSPVLAGPTGVEYSQRAYLWIGYGVWAQLWGMWTLPLAWACSWRAIRHGTHGARALALAAFTVAAHFETGYLALLPLPLWPLIRGPAPLLVRARRAGLLLVGIALATAWVTVPLIDQKTWAATNEVLRGTPLENGYGAPRVLGWLVSGRLMDAGHIPLISLLAAVGAVCGWRRTGSRASRALTVAFAGCLVLAFGRATFGSLIALVPGSGDLFFRRFMMGAQLAALLLAGAGAAALLRLLGRLAASRLRRRRRLGPLARRRPAAAAAVAGLAAAVLVQPAAALISLYHANALDIRDQRRSEHALAPALDRLIGIASRRGGRLYAGMPSNWGTSFTIGQVPVFKYLESRDVDEVGYTLRTASLMTDPEYQLDDRDPGVMSLLGVHNLLLPAAWSPTVPARRVARAGPYALWSAGPGGYLRLGRLVGRVAADRTDVGSLSIPLLHSGLPGAGEFLTVRFPARAGGWRLPAPARRSDIPGRVDAERAALPRGELAATVTMARPGVAVLSASFDPGWRVRVDDRPAPATMVAPALVGVRLAAGRHQVSFSYHGYGGDPWLVLLLALSPAVLPGRRLRRRRSGRRAAA